MKTRDNQKKEGKMNATKFCKCSSSYLFQRRWLQRRWPRVLTIEQSNSHIMRLQCSLYKVDYSYPFSSKGWKPQRKGEIKGIPYFDRDFHNWMAREVYERERERTDSEFPPPQAYGEIWSNLLSHRLPLIVFFFPYFHFVLTKTNQF